MAGSHSKESFFVSLEQLDDSDDQDERYEEWERLLYSNKYKASSKVVPAPVAERISLPRANSDPQPSPSTHQYKASTLAKDSKPVPLVRHQTTGNMPAIKSGAQKKRRINSVKVIPEAQQIFKDLVFCGYSVVFLDHFSLTYRT
jgi:DNA polymerase IV